MNRPAALFPLFAGLETLPGVGPKAAGLFPAMGVERPRDLLFTLPYAVVDRRPVASIRSVSPPATATLAVTVLGGTRNVAGSIDRLSRIGTRGHVRVARNVHQRLVDRCLQELRIRLDGCRSIRQGVGSGVDRGRELVVGGNAVAGRPIARAL